MEEKGYYAQFAGYMSLLLMGCFAAFLGALVSVMILTIYTIAYILPIIGVGMIVSGIAAAVGGQPGLALQSSVVGLLIIAFGSAVYNEYFIGEYGDLVPITEVPWYISEGVKSYRNK